MYYSNYNPFYTRNRNYYNRGMTNTSIQNTLNNKENIKENEKKDIEPPQSDTISFQKFYNNNTSQNKEIDSSNINENEDNIHTNNYTTRQRNNKFISFDKNEINILGFSFEIDDLIIIGIIILLLLESEENYALIIILGLILLNVNLSDILNIF